jgi:type IV secretory pathway TrbF-like protein
MAARDYKAEIEQVKATEPDPVVQRQKIKAIYDEAHRDQQKSAKQFMDQEADLERMAMAET